MRCARRCRRAWTTRRSAGSVPGRAALGCWSARPAFPSVKRSPLLRTDALKQGTPLKRTTALSRGKPLARARLPRKVSEGHSAPASTRQRVNYRRWSKGKAKRCEVCGNPRGLSNHHTVYEQHVRAEGGDISDPANALTVCVDCHMNHHAGAQRLKVGLLRESNFAFAWELLGDAAVDYFRRYYDCSDDRRLQEAIQHGGSK